MLLLINVSFSAAFENIISVHVDEYHLLEKSCLLGQPIFSMRSVYSLFYFSHIGFDGRILVLLVPVPGH